MPVMPGDLLLRCSDGHLYWISRDSLRWRSIHIGYTQYRPCGVDGKWRKAKFVAPETLPPSEVQASTQYRV